LLWPPAHQPPESGVLGDDDWTTSANGVVNGLYPTVYSGFNAGGTMPLGVEGGGW